MYLRNQVLQTPGNESIHQTADDYIIKQVTTSNLRSVTCRMHPLLYTRSVRKVSIHI